MTEDEMVGWHHQLNGHGFEQTLGAGDGQGDLACCSPWGHKESDTEQVDSSNNGGAQWTLNREALSSQHEQGSPLLALNTEL